ncbi:aromatic ring-hydroxylating dioxygenase subunit alpha [Gammaproteobacteria bacterium]|nr:aromatic ring-hydroxylating dioxygenase subunit alpha [Gammaproteobacteria bacterium]
MKRDRSELLTQSGSHTGAGKLLRQYWMPVALSDELISDRALVPVNIMGENLILFKTENDELGLIGRHCPHRGVDLSYGRLEKEGLRCPFHGWYFGRDGQCIEQPAEPVNSTLYEKIKTTAYPVVERNGIIFSFMGTGSIPSLPSLDCFEAPSSHVFAFKGLWQCNWLQALEVGIDPAHASFLHRFFEDENPKDQYGKQFRDAVANTNIPITKILREHHRPQIELEETNYGIRIKTLRHLEKKQTHVRITNQIFPCAISIPMSNTMTITQWHVPIDDHNCFWYSMFTSFSEPVNKKKMRDQRLAEHTLPDYLPLRNKTNQYGYDVEEQKNYTYTGMGMDINVHDQWACESMGPIQNRTMEHLGTTDKAISAYRRLLLQTISKVEEGEGNLIGNFTDKTANRIRGPIALDVVGPTKDCETIWLDEDAKRRAECPWDATL